MRNAFKISNAIVYIESGFIPQGKEYVRLQEVLESKSEKRGSFRMQFKNGIHQNAVVLQVNFSKPIKTA
jgi:hypothetical protein